MRQGDPGPDIFNGYRDFYRVVSFGYHGVYLYNAGAGVTVQEAPPSGDFYYHQGRPVREFDPPCTELPWQVSYPGDGIVPARWVPVLL